jgi:hypothetical protein
MNVNSTSIKEDMKNQHCSKEIETLFHACIGCNPDLRRCNPHVRAYECLNRSNIHLLLCDSRNAVHIKDDKRSEGNAKRVDHDKGPRIPEVHPLHSGVSLRPCHGVLGGVLERNALCCYVCEKPSKTDLFLWMRIENIMCECVTITYQNMPLRLNQGQVTR